MNLSWILCSAVLYTVYNQAQSQSPCTSKDPGPFLATLPTLTMDIFEATQQDLMTSPESYRAEVRVHGQVNGQGADGIVLEVMPDYSFLNPEDTFRFESHNGNNYVELYKPLDRDGPTAALDDDTNVFSFTLKCALRSNMSDYTFYDAKIFVLDVNDNDPEFQDLTTTLSINELTPVDMTVLSVRATDKDLTFNMTYSVLPSPDMSDDMSDRFEMDPRTGDLKVTSPLDYEAMSMGTLVITVTDEGTPARTSTAILEVVVEDGDDQGPAFVYPGCWTHMQRCSWPKYTASTTLKNGVPITVRPVPNKVHADVAIKARDLDAASNPIRFSIASTIPPGSENMFTVSTSQTGSGEYQATITPIDDMTVNHGFEIFLKAEEQSENRRFEVAMIFFEDANNVCASSSGQSGTSDDSSSSSSSSSNDDNKYTEPVIALIVVVAILAAFLFCLAIAFFRLLRKSSSGAKNSDVALNRGVTNGGYSL